MRIKIEQSAFSSGNPYEITDMERGKRLQRIMGGMFPFYFSADHVSKILDKKQFAAFEAGEQFFEVTKKTLSLMDDYYYHPSFSDRAYLMKKVSIVY